ncbi:hypothetical protein K505DRAFT_414074 [Melanomma pulvis-pyrius CBS 109.77]|uniref:Mid2 domain-containing protein n=1 Tax=Melanomma pulvis-pyrius CBS 109.77 TaxID=1314802 RepID=A0A6A6XRK3_9PLEO|nr:hypothetical protein K505DRAFT_414074 [Melanomma pulvis-pyrius CBS 109.77]
MLAAILLLFSVFNIVISSDIATFQDKKCSASLDSINGPNGYPNGTCTPLVLKSTQSFQIVGLDKGCQVTLYGPDTGSDPCSADILILGKIGACYNSTWDYYSIDGCDIPTITPSATPLVLPSSMSTISSSSSSTSTSTSTSASASSTAISNTSATASPAPATPEKSNHLPLIIGASLGGIGVVALITIAALLLIRHRRSNARRPEPPSYELSNDRALLEATHGEKRVQTELWAHDPVQEIGRNSMHLPPVELSGDSAGGEDKKNINPLINVHMAR